MTTPPFPGASLAIDDYTLSCFSFRPLLPLFNQLISQTFVENATVVVDQHRYLAAIAVVPVAVLGVEVPNLLSGVDPAVTAGVPASRRWLES